MPVADGGMRSLRSIRKRCSPLGSVRCWPDSTAPAIDQNVSCHPPIGARGGSRCCRSCQPKMPHAGTVMTAQTEEVEFFPFDNSYPRLPDRLFARVSPTPVASPHLVRLNDKLAWHLE